MRILMVVIAIGACAACSSGAQHTRLGSGHPRKAAAPVALRRTPGWAAAACGTVAQLRGTCPTAIPATPKRGWELTFAGPRPNLRMATWQLQSGVEWGGFNEHVHRPPVYSNVVALGGAFMRLDGHAFPSATAPVARIRDGMANGNRRRPVRLGSRTWGGRHGELSLTPSICPRVVPTAGVDGSDVSMQSWPPWPGQGHVETSWMSITWSSSGGPDPHAAHPPAFGHFEVTAGCVRHAAHYARRVPLGQITIPAGYIPTRPIPLGRRLWTSPAGSLIFGDCFANHLCYRWREHGETYQIDLHAWYPLAQTVAVLHAMVASTPVASATR
jgi:hypothetical protein